MPVSLAWDLVKWEPVGASEENAKMGNAITGAVKDAAVGSAKAVGGAIGWTAGEVSGAADTVTFGASSWAGRGIGGAAQSVWNAGLGDVASAAGRGAMYAGEKTRQGVTTGFLTDQFPNLSWSERWNMAGTAKIQMGDAFFQRDAAVLSSPVKFEDWKKTDGYRASAGPMNILSTIFVDPLPYGASWRPLRLIWSMSSYLHVA